MEILKISNGIDEIGAVRWQIALCLLLAWTLTFLALSKGVKSVGKVTCCMYFVKKDIYDLHLFFDFF